MVRLCYGIDDSKVILFGDFKLISDEDFFKKCLIFDDVRKCFKSFIDGLFSRVFYDFGIF